MWTTKGNKIRGRRVSDILVFGYILDDIILTTQFKRNVLTTDPGSEILIPVQVI